MDWNFKQIFLRKHFHLDFSGWKGAVNNTLSNMRQKSNSTTKEKYRKQQQRGGFLSKYDFAYAGRNTVNQVGKTVPGIIKNADSEINNFAQ